MIGATLLYKHDYALSNENIVISHTGYDDFIVVLNTVTNEVREINMEGTVAKRFITFKVWFEEFRK